MLITIIDKFGNKKEFTRDHVPRIGDRLNWVYEPMPTVTAVIWSEYLNQVTVVLD
jgi:hypothetical protein